MKIKSFALLGAAALMLSACSQEDFKGLEKPTGTGKVLYATIEQPQTRSIVDESRTNISWTEGDAFSLVGENFTCKFELRDASTGKFENIDGNYNESKQYQYAIYPYNSSHRLYDGKIKLNLPHVYGDFETEYTPNLNAIMMAEVGEDNGNTLNFKHLGGVFEFKLKDVPAGTNTFRLRTPQRQISGEFTVQDDEIKINEKPEYNEQRVEFRFKPITENRDMTFYVPVPVGEYPDFIIETGEQSNPNEYLYGLIMFKAQSYFNKICKTKNTISRGELLYFPEVTATPNDFFRKTLYEGGELDIDDYIAYIALSYDHETLEIPEGVEVTIKFLDAAELYLEDVKINVKGKLILEMDPYRNDKKNGSAISFFNKLIQQDQSDYYNLKIDGGELIIAGLNDNQPMCIDNWMYVNDTDECPSLSQYDLIRLDNNAKMISNYGFIGNNSDIRSLYDDSKIEYNFNMNGIAILNGSTLVSNNDVIGAANYAIRTSAEEKAGRIEVKDSYLYSSSDYCAYFDGAEDVVIDALSADSGFVYGWGCIYAKNNSKIKIIGECYFNNLSIPEGLTTHKRDPYNIIINETKVCEPRCIYNKDGNSDITIQGGVFEDDSFIEYIAPGYKYEFSSDSRPQYKIVPKE